MSFPIKPFCGVGDRKWKLRSELLVSHVGLVLLSIIAFSSLLLAMSLHATYRRAEADLLAVAQELNQDLKMQTSPTQLTISDLYRHRFGMAPRDHAYIGLWDQQGNLVFRTPGLPASAKPFPNPPPVRGPHPFQTRAAGRHFNLIVTTPQQGQLLIGRPLAKEWDALQWLFVRILGLGTLCVAGASGLAIWLANRFSAPLTQLAETAERITDRHLEQRIGAIEGSHEIHRLGMVFDQMLNRLQIAFERQSRFIADASHELRTPVAIVLSQSEHALHRQRSQEEYRQAFDVCLRSSRRMKSLIEDLLFLARADAGMLTLRRSIVDLAEVAAQAVELLRPLADKQGIRLETDLATGLVSGDRLQLAQVIANLVTNGIRYNREQGDVTVVTKTVGHDVILQVRDHGIGIPLEDQPRLFDRFYRVDTARSLEDDTGTGLGLSLVREIVLAHDGRIEVVSEPGRGTTMTVRFPGKSAELLPGAPEEARQG